MQCTWLQARGRLRDAPDCVDGLRDGNMGGGLASPYTFLGAAGHKSCMAGNRTRFLRICVPRVILRSLTAYRKEKPLILRLRTRSETFVFLSNIRFSTLLVFLTILADRVWTTGFQVFCLVLFFFHGLICLLTQCDFCAVHRISTW